MADIADTAQEYEEAHINHALAARKGVAKQLSEDCIECGLHISEARQKATGGTDVCVGCAEILERQGFRD